MIKIFLSCRNRLAITCKCITAIKKHSKLPNQIYIYDNASNYKIEEHFMYWSILYKNKLISQVTITSEDSTFHAFSKATTSNLFGLQHMQDPKKNNYDYLLFLDNDVIVTPGFDEILKNAWDDVNKLGWDHIKLISQKKSGIQNKKDISEKIAGLNAITGNLGGSCLWSVRPNFFEDVGLLDLSKLVGYDKKHDQHYWQLLEKSSGGKDYILGVDSHLGIHCGGKISGSVCNTLTRNHLNKNKYNMIKFEEQDKKIDSMTFDYFYNMIIQDKELLDGW